MPRELGDLGRTVSLRPARRGRHVVVLLAALLVLTAVVVRASDDDGDRTPSDAITAAGVAVVAEAPSGAFPGGPVAEDEDQAPDLPVLGRAGGLLVHVPAQDPVLVSYHEAAFPQARVMTPLGELTHNDNPTRSLTAEPHRDGLPFHVQVSRGRANGPTSAVDVVLAPGDEVLAPVAGTVTEVRPYQLYGTHDDVRLELRPDDSELLVVLIHVEDVAVTAGDRVAVGDLLAGGARLFPFSAVVDRQTEPDRFGHVHMEIKAPELTGDEATAPD